MNTRTVALASLVLVVLASCAAWHAPGGGAGTGSSDIDDVNGAEMVPSERERARAQDQAEAGIRIREDGEVEAGGTDVGERVRPEPPDAGPLPPDER